MIIYVDLVFLINFIVDFYIISGVKFLLHINTKFYRIILSSIVGALSVFLLLFKINNTELNIIKALISIIMVIIAFGKRNFFNNIFYMYIISIVLGGSLYLINDSLGYEVDGLMFINNGYSINIIILLSISPVIIYLYLREFKKYKKRINTIYDCIIRINKKDIRVKGFLDTGNKLKDPYFNRPIILVNKKYIKKTNRVIYVPYKSLNNSGLLNCIIPEYILIDNKKYNNCLVGIMDNLKYDCILNERIFDYEGIN